jgi:predicted alpha/beta superfamily hydrolase
MRFTGLVFTLLTGCAAAPVVPAGPAPTPSAAPTTPTTSTTPTGDVAAPLGFGETFRLASKLLGEDRVINVYLPPGYAGATTRFPVLYALDGGIKEDFPHVAGIVDVSIKNEVIRPLIVVGIENTERRRDLVARSTIADEQTIAPHAGGADRFRQFLRDELKPAIARRYRITDEAAVIGESFAGLFVVETLLQDPELFDTYIAIDPSVWWNAAALVKTAPERFARWTAKPRRLFVATADWKPTQDAVNLLMTALRDRRPVGLTATHEPLPAEHHGTIFPVAEVRAYRALFAVPAK